MQLDFFKKLTLEFLTKTLYHTAIVDGILPATEALCPKCKFPKGLQTTKNLSNAITAIVFNPAQP